jgi:hypothetical protein
MNEKIYGPSTQDPELLKLPNFDGDRHYLCFSTGKLFLRNMILMEMAKYHYKN